MHELQSHPIGNPVDTWWSTTRNLVSPCLHLFAQFPPARNATTARHMLTDLRNAYQAVESTPTPEQALPARQYLLKSLHFMTESLKEQAVLGINKDQKTYRAACRHYMQFTKILLRRGIYEPMPQPQTAKTS